MMIQYYCPRKHENNEKSRTTWGSPIRAISSRTTRRRTTRRRMIPITKQQQLLLLLLQLLLILLLPSVILIRVHCAFVQDSFRGSHYSTMEKNRGHAITISSAAAIKQKQQQIIMSKKTKTTTMRSYRTNLMMIRRPLLYISSWFLSSMSSSSSSSSSGRNNNRQGEKFSNNNNNTDTNQSSSSSFGREAVTKKKTNATVILSPQEEARQLLAKAKQIREEILEMEIELALSKTKLKQRIESEWRRILYKIFPDTENITSLASLVPSSITPASVARCIRRERLSENTVLALIDYLYNQRKLLIQENINWLTTGTNSADLLNYRKNATTTTTTTSVLLPETTINWMINQTSEIDKITIYMKYIADAAGILDEEVSAAITNNSSTTTSSSSSSTTTTTVKNDNFQPQPQQTKNAVWTGRGMIMINARINEWRRMEEAEYKQQQQQQPIDALLKPVTQQQQQPVATSSRTNRSSRLARRIQEYIAKAFGLSSKTDKSTQKTSKQQQQPSSTSLQQATTTASTATAGSQNVSSLSSRVVTTTTEQRRPAAELIPMWVPSSLLRLVVSYQQEAKKRTNNTIIFETTGDDVRTIKDKVLTKTRFFCTSSEYISNVAVFRGNIRPPPPPAAAAAASASNTFSTGITARAAASSSSKTAAAAAKEKRRAIRAWNSDVFKEIQDGMKKEGLADRIQLFFIEDPEWKPDNNDNNNNKDAATRSSESKPKPIILALPQAIQPHGSASKGIVQQEPKQQQQQQQSLISMMLKQAVIAFTLLTTISYSISCYALNPSLFDAVIYKQTLRTLVPTCIPVFVGIVAIQAIHEAAHYIVARRNGMKIGLPLPLPSTHLGLFGCITPLRSFPPTRSALLDFSLSGPIAGIVVSTVLMIIGSMKTVYASQAALLRFPVITVAYLKSSFLAGSILTYLLPKAMMLPQSQPIPIHPLFMIGFSGLLASALNLLPIFRLDGGRACKAAVGHRLSELTSAWTLLCLLSLALSGSGIAWGWGGLVLLFQRRPEIPARDEVTSVNDARIGVWIASILAAVLALAPFPGGPGML